MDWIPDAYHSELEISVRGYNVLTRLYRSENIASLDDLVRLIRSNPNWHKSLWACGKVTKHEIERLAVEALIKELKQLHIQIIGGA